MILQFIAGVISCIGFAYLFNCPKKAIIKSAIGGGLGWLMYYYSVHTLHISVVISTFLGTLVLSIICEILARIEKDAVTIFVIPAILPLVPGAGLYYTLLYFIEGNFSQATTKGLETLGCAAGIAIGIIFVSSISRFIFRVILVKRQKKS